MTIPYSGGDIVLYQDIFDLIVPLKERFDIIDLYNFIFNNSNNSKIEIYVPTVIYLISFFTNDVAFAFVVTGFVYYLAWSNIVGDLMTKLQTSDLRDSKQIFFLIICFAIYIIFFRAINGRFYLAYWISILSIYQILYKNNIKYYLLFLATVLIHQSYIIVFLLFVLTNIFSQFFKVKYLFEILFVLFVIGNVFSEAGFNKFSNFLSSSEFALASGYKDYIKESYISGQLERDRKWFLVFRTPFLFFSTYTLCFLLGRRFKYQLSEANYKLFIFILVFAMINAFTINVPSFGDRFRNILIGFMFLFIVNLYLTQKKVVFNSLLYLVFGALIFYKIVTLRVFAEYINVYAYSPLPLIFDYFSESSLPLIDLF